VQSENIKYRTIVLRKVDTFLRSDHLQICEIRYLQKAQLSQRGRATIRVIENVVRARGPISGHICQLLLKNIMKNKILQLFMDGADRTYTEVNIRRKIYHRPKYKFIKHTDGIY